MTLELRPLRHLLALAEHGGFGRAAAALHITQPALSRSIKLLEAQVGATLFERSVSGATPTDEGRLLILRARQLIAAADEVDREILHRRRPGSGQLVIGAGPYPGETVVPAALAPFATANPLVHTRVVVRGDWDELLRRLRARELDVLVAEISTLDGEPDLEVEPLTEHRLYFAARDRHPLARRVNLRLDQALNHPFIALSRIPPRVLQPLLSMRPAVDPGRPERPFPAIELSSLDAVKRILLNSDAIAPLTLSCVAEELERGSIALLWTEAWLTTRYGLVRLKGRRPSAAAHRFCECLREAEADLVARESQLAARFRPETKARTARRKQAMTSRP